MAKFASMNRFLSFRFIMFYGVEILILGIYALLWQQVLKRFELSIAYANRSIAIVWSSLWAFCIFNEEISANNIIGIMIVLIGTIMVNANER